MNDYLETFSDDSDIKASGESDNESYEEFDEKVLTKSRSKLNIMKVSF